MNRTVYLAGPMTGLTYKQALEWRRKASELLQEHGYKTLSPMRGHMKGPGAVIDGLEEAETSVGLTAKALKNRDKIDVKRSAALLVYFGGKEGSPSLGTAIEFGWADDEDIPIIVIGHPENPNIRHFLMQELITIVVPTLEDGVEALVSHVGY